MESFEKMEGVVNVILIAFFGRFRPKKTKNISNIFFEIFFENIVDIFSKIYLKISVCFFSRLRREMLLTE